MVIEIKINQIFKKMILRLNKKKLLIFGKKINLV